MYGIMFALKDAKLPGLKHARDQLMKIGFFHEMLSCSFCTGFHAGWLTFLLEHRAVSLCDMLLYGFVGASFCYITDTIVLKLERS
jgi:hypothetical protein